jgi:hypothetical protein
MHAQLYYVLYLTPIIQFYYVLSDIIVRWFRSESL